MNFLENTLTFFTTILSQKIRIPPSVLTTSKLQSYPINQRACPNTSYITPISLIYFSFQQRHCITPPILHQVLHHHSLSGLFKPLKFQGNEWSVIGIIFPHSQSIICRSPFSLVKLAKGRKSR